MKIEKAILERRSIRDYTDKLPKDKDIERILTAGIWAPSGLNNQPWKFKVVKSEQKDGLATCWLGEILNKKKDVQKYLGIDDDFELMAVLTLGYPEAGIEKSCRKNLRNFMV